MKINNLALTACLLCAMVAAQNITANTLTTNVMNITDPTLPAVVPAATVFPGQPGPSTYVYWIVSRGTGSIMSGPFVLLNAEAAITVGFPNTISWEPQPRTAAYDLLRTSTQTAPTGQCNCAVVIGSTSTSVLDQSNATLAYSVPSLSVPTKFTNGYPAITSTGIEGVIYADQLGASGSAASTSGACIAGSPLLSLDRVGDFRAGQGIALYGCGLPAFGGSGVSSPVPSIINWCGANGQMACSPAPGTTTYEYEIVAEDGAGGYAAAGSTAITTTGAATLGISCCNSVIGANYLSWSAPSGITTNSYGYFVYANSGGVWRLDGLAGIPGYAIPWIHSHPYPPGSYAVPLASPNGSYYVAITGGTSGTSEPSWCTSSATCQFADGGVTWQRQPFTWMDYGQTAVAPAWVPSSPPAAGQADRLVAAVAGGAGTAALTLSVPAVTSTATTAYHDDTAAIQAAVNAAVCTVMQPTGNAPSANCPEVVIPVGSSYRVTSPIAAGPYLSIGGEGRILGDEPFDPILDLPSAQALNITGIHFSGGQDAVFVDSAAADASVVNITGVDVRYTTSYALSIGTQEGIGCGSVDCVGLSTNVSGQAYGDRMFLFTGGDWATVEPNTWVEPFLSAQPYEGQMLVTLGRSLAIHGMVGVPDSTPYARWVDDWGAASVVVDGNARLGGENGGISAVYLLGGFGANQAFNWPLATVGLGAPFDYLGSNIVLKNSMVLSGNISPVTLINNSFPQRYILADTYWGINTQPVGTCSGVNQSALTSQPCALPAGFTPTNLDTVLEGELPNVQFIRWNIDSTMNTGPQCHVLQPALLPLMQATSCATSPSLPTAGIWDSPGTNGTSMRQVAVWNSVPINGSVLGWILPTNGATFGGSQRAAPAWQASHTYTLATSPFGEGDDFVSTATNAFYVSGVSSGSTCTSGGTTPSWNTSVNNTTGAGATTADGSCTWTVEAVGSQAQGSFGYVAPFSAFPAASFLPFGAVGVLGTGVSVLSSALPLSATVAASVVSVAANSCGDAVAATITGATTGMTATASGEGALPSAGLLLQAAVTAANTVTIKYCNTTTSAIVPAALNVAVRVVQ